MKPYATFFASVLAVAVFPPIVALVFAAPQGTTIVSPTGGLQSVPATTWYRFREPTGFNATVYVRADAVTRVEIDDDAGTVLLSSREGFLGSLTATAEIRKQLAAARIVDLSPPPNAAGTRK